MINPTRNMTLKTNSNPVKSRLLYAHSQYREDHPLFELFYNLLKKSIQMYYFLRYN